MRYRPIFTPLMLFTLTFGASVLMRHDREPQSTIRPMAIGRQFVAVLVMSPACSQSDAIRVGREWRELLVELRRRGVQQGVDVHTVGVSIDYSTDAALAALTKFGAFDELAVGGGWQNTSALQYVIRNVAGPPSVPQVILLERTILSGPAISVSEDSLIVRLQGPEAVGRWTRRLKGTLNLNQRADTND